MLFLQKTAVIKKMYDIKVRVLGRRSHVFILVTEHFNYL